MKFFKETVSSLLSTTFVFYEGIYTTFNLKKSENILATVLSIFIMIFFRVIDLYNNFLHYQEFILDITKNILIALITVMGIIITSLALLITLLNDKKRIKKIEEAGLKESMNTIVKDFSSMNSAIIFVIVYSIIISFLLRSDIQLVIPIGLIVIIFSYSYFFFSIVINIAAMGNIIIETFEGVNLLDSVDE